MADQKSGRLVRIYRRAAKDGLPANANQPARPAKKERYYIQLLDTENMDHGTSRMVIEDVLVKPEHADQLAGYLDGHVVVTGRNGNLPSGAPFFYYEGLVETASRRATKAA